MIKSPNKREDKGFTLVELLIIIAVMSVLAMTISLVVVKYIEKAREAKDVYHAGLIKDALNTYEFPSDFQGRDVEFIDPETGDRETYERGWVYVDKDEIRCSDQSTALAMIYAGLVVVSPETEQRLRENEESPVRWFPSGPDGDYIRRTAIDEYAFKNNLTVQARRTWNTYQLDVYVSEDGELHMGASASDAIRVGGHAKDEYTAQMFAKKLGFYHSLSTPIGEQNSD